MLLHNSFQSNTAILNTKAVQHNTSDWEFIYDTYSPMMYGTILKMTDDARMADIILEEIFMDINQKGIFLAHHTPLNHILLQYTFKSTLKHLEMRGMKVHKTFNAYCPLINQFYFEQKVLKDVASALDITMQEVLLNLRAEFNHFCN